MTLDNDITYAKQLGAQSAQAMRHNDISLVNFNNNYVNRMANLRDAPVKQAILLAYHDAYKETLASYDTPRSYSGTW